MSEMPPRFDAAAFARVVRVARAKKNVTQKQAAPELRVSNATWSRIEAGGTPSADTLVAMLAWMGLPDLEDFRMMSVRVGYLDAAGVQQSEELDVPLGRGRLHAQHYERQLLGAAASADDLLAEEPFILEVPRADLPALRHLLDCAVTLFGGFEFPPGRVDAHGNPIMAKLLGPADDFERASLAAGERLLTQIPAD
ncbi:MAG: helix-turn-helix transcriptional regulator [bacterium]|nr:helix-turn-helix transcriptional regulator [bacterium]